MLTVLDLFSGIGGFSLGLEATGGFRTVQFCEIDPYCRRVLEKHWPDVPCHDDVRTLAPVHADVVVGGYPCQPFSQAGKRQGSADDRHLWPHMLRLITAIRPTWVVAENVAGHVRVGLDQVLSDLEGIDYACRPFVIPACAVGAPHIRKRVWIVAHAGRLDQGRTAGGREARDGAARGGATVAHAYRDGCEIERLEEHAELESSPGTESDGCDPGRQRDGATVADADGSGSSLGVAGLAPGTQRRQARRELTRHRRWAPEPAVDRVAHGVPSRVDRVKALGNSVVPRAVMQIGYAILESDE